MGKTIPQSVELQGREDIRRKIFRIERLAALPQVVWQLVEALGDDNITVKKLVELIESDPALASRILSLANSAYYSLTQKCTTIDRAVVVIGFQELHMLALGAGLAEVFDTHKMPAGFDGLGIWTHCLAVSWIARELAVMVNHDQPGEVMVAGLLHDIGKLVLATHFRDEYSRMIDLVDQGLPYYEAEKQTELSHDVIGYWLACRWALPEIHTAVIRDHHAPQPQDLNHNTTCLVYLADRLAKAMGFGIVHQSRSYDYRLALEALGMTIDDFRSMALTVQKNLPGRLEHWQQMLDKGSPLVHQR